MGAPQLAVTTKDFCGIHPIYRYGKQIGEIHIAYGFERLYVTLKVDGTFLRLDELQQIIERMKHEFHIPDEQQIALEQW